ncbi:glycosyltransferase [Maribellus comscasis]|uniref:Glycosyltransferase n=1 Tax=Maribellus comscasis TaxID=2681766 RepID=A0A6I6JWG0_9BACT|nr:glycosyltransferase family 2 protein [Maribellus comscasis]QGY44447.1 glycosyltransferase [Maribellus comscasis]
MAIPKISIITIVFNDVKHIEGTILSVLEQTNDNIEYIIIDGSSSDGTLDVIKKYADKLSYWISEKDDGIYDAMNKGLRAATGDFIWFLNSGDQIHEKTAVDKFIQKIDEETDVIYGETVLIDEDGNILGMRRKKAPENLTWKSFFTGMMVCHQSVLVRRSVAPEYNEKYRFSADFEWVLVSLKKARKVVNSHQILSRYLEEGATTQNHKASLKERFEIMKRYFGFIPTVLIHVWLAFTSFFFSLQNKGDYRPFDSSKD